MEAQALLRHQLPLPALPLWRALSLTVQAQLLLREAQASRSSANTRDAAQAAAVGAPMASAAAAPQVLVLLDLGYLIRQQQLWALHLLLTIMAALHLDRRVMHRRLHYLGIRHGTLVLLAVRPCVWLVQASQGRHAPLTLSLARHPPLLQLPLLLEHLRRLALSDGPRGLAHRPRRLLAKLRQRPIRRTG